MANLIIIRLVNDDTVTAENWSMFQRAVLLHSWIMLFIPYSLPVKQTTILINHIVNEQVKQKRKNYSEKKSWFLQGVGSPYTLL